MASEVSGHDTMRLLFVGLCQRQSLCPTIASRDLMKLRERIREAFAAVKRDLLMRVWTEMDYRLDICRVTKGAHIESL